MSGHEEKWYAEDMKKWCPTRHHVWLVLLQAQATAYQLGGKAVLVPHCQIWGLAHLYGEPPTLDDFPTLALFGAWLGALSCSMHELVRGGL